MKRRLRILPEAAEELTAAAEWYEERRPGLGVELIATLDGALEEILASPTTFAFWARDYRKLVVRRFPYVVFFRLVGDDVEVVAFAHARRRPGYWVERTRRPR
ncbi:MAG: type II toxin-antitoxin system RelE/ParE family toxin [Acidobacteriota bacterium]